MADYYSILEKTISGLPSNTQEVRNAVYSKARAAIEKQLRGMDPPPSEDAINAQLQLLEEAIVLIDAENSPSVADAPSPLDVVEEVTAPEAVVEEPVVDNVDEPETVLDQGSTEAQDEPLTTSDTSYDASRPLAGSADIPEPPTASAEALDSVLHPPNETAGISSAEAAALDAGEVKSSGGFGSVLKVLVVLGLLGGAGYAVYKNKTELTEVAGDLWSRIASSSDTAETETAVQQPETNTSPEPAPQQQEQPEPQVEEIPSAEPEPETPPAAPELEVVEPEPAPTEEPPANAETNTEPEVAEPLPTDQQSGVIPIGEVAYLYEEGSAGGGATRTNAAVTWETRRESLGDGLAPEPVIVGKMDVPEKGVTLDIVIKRNVDAALSASHLIELQFNVPQDFAGKSIESIARFVMKRSEEAPGEPLVAVPVKVQGQEGKFLVALDNLKQAVDVNTQLMKDSSWIDIPVVYSTGKRALVTLEKGGTGERVFVQAFEDWQNR